MHLVAADVDHFGAPPGEEIAIPDPLDQIGGGEPSGLASPRARKAAEPRDRVCRPDKKLSVLDFQLDPILGRSIQKTCRKAREAVLDREAAAKLARRVDMNQPCAGI
jgi:hypothetical protein